jgi:uncharacterized protein (UPF0333 family)
MLIALRHKKNGQSFLEYAILIMIVVAAVLAMYPYVRKAVGARLKNIQVELDEARR